MNTTQPLHVNGWSCHRLVREGFTLNKDGEWVKDKWSILLHDDYVSVSHEAWNNAECANDISEALELIVEWDSEWYIAPPSTEKT